MKNWVGLTPYLKVSSDPDDSDEQTALGLLGNGGILQVRGDNLEQGNQKTSAFGREESARI